MAIIRWNPFLRMPRIWEDEDWEDVLDMGQGLAVDMYETKDDVVIKTDLPGLKPEEVDITVTGDTVTIRGEKKEEEEEKGKSYLRRERRYERYARSVSLPAAVKADKADAKFVDGTLTLTLPKAEEAKPKTIKVKAKK
ncbi:MAG: Hsp20/alpha crystallin family protein [Candidatus Cloacimonetes bacterium]|nr:Hsp20/alpha crystallin family protein [Candidatus Cloacimonadota bacterium]